MSDTSEWWVLPEGVPWRVALNGKNKGHCINVVTGEQCNFAELIAKTHRLTQQGAIEKITETASRFTE